MITQQQQAMITFVISIVVALIAILVPVFTYREALNLTAYKVDGVIEDRKIVWERQAEIDKQQSKCLTELKELMIRIDARENKTK